MNRISFHPGPAGIPWKDFIVPFLCGMMLLGCNRTPSGPAGTAHLLSRGNLTNVIMTLTDYDKVSVTHALGAALETREVKEIVVGFKDSTGFHALDTIAMAPTADPDVLTTMFQSIVKIDRTLISAIVTVRYTLDDESYQDVERTVDMYKYPYATAWIVMRMSELSEFPGIPEKAQDIARIGNLLFVHPLGPYGLYSYDLMSSATQHLLIYGSGDHLAADSPFLFHDIGGRPGEQRIDRFNVATGQVDLQIPVDATIVGMDTFEGSLYVHVTGDVLRKYSYAGVLIDSVTSFPSYLYMTIHDGIAFQFDYQNDRLIRFDLNSQMLLQSVMAPARNGDGIKIYDGTLYYCDYNKGFVGAVPVSDLKTAN